MNLDRVFMLIFSFLLTLADFKNMYHHMVNFNAVKKATSAAAADIYLFIFSFENVEMQFGHKV